MYKRQMLMMMMMMMMMLMMMMMMMIMIMMRDDITTLAQFPEGQPVVVIYQVALAHCHQQSSPWSRDTAGHKE